MVDWGTDAVMRELAGAAKGFEVALAGLTEAAEYAKRARDRMLPGLPGVARSIGRIKDAIEANHREVGELAEQVSPLSEAVETVSSDWTPDQVIAALSPAQDDLDALSRATLITANRSLADTAILIRRLLEGGSPEHLHARVERPRSVLRAAHSRLTKATEATDAVLASARQAGQGGAGGGGGQNPPGGPPVPAGVPEGEPEPVGPDADIPRFVQRIADTFHHVSQGSQQAVGYLVDRQGRPLHDGRIISGSDGPGLTAPGLRPESQISRWETTRKHVEGHAAAMLRRPGAATDAVLVISEEPCDGPRGCRRILPHILPDNTVLTVYVAKPGQPPRYFDQYTGNGRALAR